MAGLSAAVVAALPWLVAAAVARSLASSQAEGVAAFAARAEPGLGTLLSLAGLGGIWNGEAVPASRTTLFAVVATVVLLGVVALGLPVAVRRPAAVPLLVLAAVAVVVPALMATGPGLAATEAVIRTLPGLGVLRDAQKWVALAVPGYAVAGAGAVLALRRVPA
ncbi:membrane protein, partial [Mycolicibacterium phlei DSM 43071]